MFFTDDRFRSSFFCFERVSACFDLFCNYLVCLRNFVSNRFELCFVKGRRRHGPCTHYKNGRRSEVDYVRGPVEELQYRRPSDGKSKHLRVLVVRFSRFAVCQMLAYSTSSTVSLAFGKNHHNKQAQMCSQLWGWRCSTRRR